MKSPLRWASGGSLSVLAVGLALIYLALVPPGIIVIDAISMFNVAKSLATGFDVSVPCGVSGFDALVPDLPSVLGRGGECYSYFYPFLSVLAAPVVGLGDALGTLVGLRGDSVAQVFALTVPALAAAGAATVTAMIALEMGATRRAAVGAAVALGFGTEVLTYARTFFAETLAAFLLALAVWGLAGAGRRRWLAFAAIALGILTKPQMLLVGPFLGLALAYRTRNLRALALPMAATATGGLVYLLYNWLRFAEFTKFGGKPTFSLGTYLSEGAFENFGILLFSPGKGLLWFSPVAVLGAGALWRRRSDLVPLLCLAGFAAVLLVYLGHSEPYVGRHWGGKYLVPALPLLCVGVASLGARARKLAAVLVVMALLAQIPTTLAFYDRTHAEHEERGVVLAEHPWSFDKSALVTAWPAMARQLRDASRTDPRELAESASEARPKSVEDTALLKVVALWWWMLPVLGIPWWVGACVSAVVIGVGLRLVWAAARAGDVRSSPERASQA